MLSKTKSFLFTSESVGEGHPDKICDQISDAILDEHLRMDKNSRVAVEVSISSKLIFIFGEVTSKSEVDYESVARHVIKDIGYDSIEKGLDYKSIEILVHINKQSSDISNALKEQKMVNIGAGDQGIMFGYATNETEERMPLTLVLSHNIVKKLSELRKSVDFLGPDCKSQVTIEYIEKDGFLSPTRVHNIVISTQHTENITVDSLRMFLIEKVIKETVPEDLLRDTIYYIQPSGRFVIGGPSADAGLTGRKIIVDSYGGFGCNGGGCFSGKDWSKVDRSGSYMARWIAKSLVDSGICGRVLIQLSYAIGVPEPLSIYVDTYGTGIVEDEEIIKIINENFDMRPGSIVQILGLREPIFRKTATYGHFGRNIFTWEQSKNLCFSKKEC